MSRRPQTPQAPEPAALRVSRAEAFDKLEAQIKRGKALRIGYEPCFESEEALEEARHELDQWRNYCRTLLAHLFTTGEFRQEFDKSLGDISVISIGGIDLEEERETLRTDVGRYVSTLVSIQQRLELIPEPPEIARSAQQTSATPKPQGKKVFIVHGHDEEAKQTVARYLESLDLEAVILHEQPSGGRTLIEKLEHYAQQAAFAVILLTPDDIGGVKGTNFDDLNPRARQNVIFELGFFNAKLGRSRVCALHRASVEILTDYSGVVYENMDNGGAWKFKLAIELREAGLSVDMNKIR